MHQRIPPKKVGNIPSPSPQHTIFPTPLPPSSPPLAVHNTPAFDLRKLLIFPPAQSANSPLKLTKPGDPEEQQAEHQAEQIMQMVPSQNDRLLSSYHASSEPHEKREDGGQPLDERTRVFMEARFGQRLKHVRIHTDRRAATAAQAVSARAYTIGRHIVFGQGEYAPGTHTGQRLLAHELTHVVSPSPRASIQRMFSIKQTLKREGEEEQQQVASGPIPQISQEEKIGAEIKGSRSGPPFGEAHFQNRYFTKIADINEASDLQELGIQDGSNYKGVRSMDPARQSLSHKQYDIPFYHSKINVDNGTIAVISAYKDEDEKNLGKGAAPYSETLFQQWIAAARHAGKDVAHLSLNKVLIHHIRESETNQLLSAIKKTLPEKDENYSHTFSSGDQRFQAILNTRFGKAVRYLLEQHPHTTGSKHIASIELRARGSGQNTHDLVFNLA